MSSGSGSFYGAGAGGFAGSPFASQRGSVTAASLRSASGCAGFCGFVAVASGVM